MLVSVEWGGRRRHASFAIWAVCQRAVPMPSTRAVVVRYVAERRTFFYGVRLYGALRFVISSDPPTKNWPMGVVAVWDVAVRYVEVGVVAVRYVDVGVVAVRYVEVGRDTHSNAEAGVTVTVCDAG